MYQLSDLAYHRRQRSSELQIFEIFHCIPLPAYHRLQRSDHQRLGQEDREVTVPALRQDPLDLEHIHEEAHIDSANWRPCLEEAGAETQIQEEPRVRTRVRARGCRRVHEEGTG